MFLFSVIGLGLSDRHLRLLGQLLEEVLHAVECAEARLLSEILAAEDQREGVFAVPVDFCKAGMAVVLMHELLVLDALLERLAQIDCAIVQILLQSNELIELQFRDRLFHPFSHCVTS